MPSRPLSALLVALGGALGSLGRWSLGLALPSPWAVLLVNLTGCLAIGLLAGAVFERSPRLRLLLGVGLLGGWTTFSGHLLDAWLLPGPTAVAYVVGTLVACVLLASVGLRVGRRLA